MNTHYKITGKALELANAFGFLYPAELFLIQAIARSIPGEPVMVCIGVGTGTGSLGMAEIQPTANLFSVDISEGGPMGGLQNERNAFRGTGLPLPTQVLGNSQIVHADWPKISGNQGIDLLFIDGDHAETALQGDIDGWVKYIKPGGYVLFHDYESENWGDVTKVVNQNMTPDKWKFILKVDTLIAYQYNWTIHYEDSYVQELAQDMASMPAQTQEEQVELIKQGLSINYDAIQSLVEHKDIPAEKVTTYTRKPGRGKK